jgi:uncharacterized protein (TIGR02145 family)/uncharacterized repeat protein (TIGR02543 family)
LYRGRLQRQGYWGGGGGETDTTYVITFDPDGGTVQPPSGATDKDGKLYSLPIPTKEGYDFKGWSTAKTDGKTVTTSTVFSKDAAIYAQWALSIYTIKFNANGGTVTPDSGLTGVGWKLTLAALPIPTKEGYTFDGWFTTATGGEAVTIGKIYSANTTIYAHWTVIPPPETYVITFNAEGGAVSPSNGATGEDGKLAALPTPTKEGYTFDGWFTAATGGTKVELSTVFPADATIYARWTLITYTITFDATGGEVTPASAITGEGGKLTLTALPTPTKEGYTFDGWFTAATGGEVVTLNKVYSAAATIHAQSTLKIYTITLDVNGVGAFFLPPNLPLDAYETVEGWTLQALPPAPTRNSYNFEGWFTLAAGGVEVTTKTPFNADAAIYAQWTWVGVTITFALDDGFGTLPPNTPNPMQTIEGGTLPYLPDAISTRENYAFNGWWPMISTGAQILPTNVFTGSGSIMPRWRWSGATYNITFDPNGGELTATLGTTEEEFRLKSLPTPTKEDYHFDGWFTESGEHVELNYVFSASVTVYARWTAVDPNAYGTFYDNRGDGQTYHWTKIGSQTWMAENLNYVVSDVSSSNACFQDNPDNCETYGRLYNWETALDACPTGWHLPSADEWNTLFNTVADGDLTVAYTKLKSAAYWVVPGTDDVSFAALPGGQGRATSWVGGNLGTIGYWWTSTASSEYPTQGRLVRINASELMVTGEQKTNRMSVRCVQND